jgi:hypothetical protein
MTKLGATAQGKFNPDDEVRFCPHCGCKAWFVGGVCEWSDGHAIQAEEREAARRDPRQANLLGGGQ